MVAHAHPEPITVYMTCTHGHMRSDVWEGMAGVPVMVVASNYYRGGRLRVRRVPPQCRPVFADCGGFAFHVKGTDYPFTYAEYIAWLEAMQPNYAASWDYPCEAEIAPDDAAVRSRQRRTTEHARVLLRADRAWQWVPVIQGRTVEQYVAHARAYWAEGLDRPYMGIGSLCRRTQAGEVMAILRAVSEVLPLTRFHLFGVKAGLLRGGFALPSCVASSDTGAWNGMFGKGRTPWKEAQARGRTQVIYEVHEAMPAYYARIGALLAAGDVGAGQTHAGGLVPLENEGEQE